MRYSRLFDYPRRSNDLPELTSQAVSGFTTVILLELIIGSLLMISLGIIGEYQARIYREVKARPRYLVTESTEPAGSADQVKP